MSEQVESLAAELERAAGRLRSGDIEPAEAADLVQRCAQLATQLGAELDRRAAEDGKQERLL
jgi:hypothetical protein